MKRYTVVKEIENGRTVYFIVDDLINRKVREPFTRRDTAEKIAKKMEMERRKENGKRKDD